jgi:hypothetical protein
MKRYLLFWIVWLGFVSVAFGGGYKYSYIPKKVYQNQIFPITITSEDKSSKVPQFEFDSWKGIRVLNQKPLIVRNGNEIFYSFYFQAKQDDLQIPRIFITTATQEYMIEPKYVKVAKLKSPPNFCGVMATSFKIKNYQISKYNDKEYLVTLSIKATEANLDDMYMPDTKEYGIDKIYKSYPSIKSEFYFITDNDKNTTTFTYYNSIKREFVPLTLKLEVDNTTVVAQSDLNPKYDSFDLLKKYLFIFLVIFFLVMFIIKRDFFYLVFGVVSFITLLTFFIPHKSICIKEKSKIYILPTYTSSVMGITTDQYVTKLLSKHKDYNKIEYKNHTIGWIKDEDVCKD